MVQSTEERRKVVCFTLDLMEDEIAGSDDLAQLVEKQGVPEGLWDVVATIFPHGAEAVPLEVYTERMSAAVALAMTELSTVDRLQKGLDFAVNKLVICALETIKDAFHYKAYYELLKLHNEEQADQHWLEEVAVRQLYRHSIRSNIHGSLLIDVPQGTPPDLRETPDIANWIRPFKKPTVQRKWYATAEQSSRSLIESVIGQVLRNSNGHLVLAGGAALYNVIHAPTAMEGYLGDYDLFLVGCKDKSEALSVIHSAVRQLAEREVVRLSNMRYRYMVGDCVTVLSEHVLSFCFAAEDYERKRVLVQFVLRLFRSIEEVLCTFDLAPCCYAYDGFRYYTTKRAVYSLRYGLAVVDPLQQSTPRRALKYNDKGYCFVVPVWDSSWEEFRERAREMSPFALAELVKEGGMKGLLAFSHLPASSYDASLASRATRVLHFSTDMELLATHLYRCLKNPGLLRSPNWREAFLQRYPSYRVCFYNLGNHPEATAADVADELLPTELLELLRTEDEPRWLIKNPALRMFSVEQFYNLDMS